MTCAAAEEPQAVTESEAEGKPEQGNAQQEQETREITQEELDHTREEMLEGLDLSDIEQSVSELLGNSGFSFTETLRALVSGQEQMDAEMLIALLKQIFIGEVSRQKQTVMQIFLLILVSALLLNFAQVFREGQVSEIAFYMVYLVIFALLVQSFGSLSGQLKEVLNQTVSFMQVLTPAYYLAIITSNGAATASAYYQFVLLAIFGVQWLLLKIVLPGVNVYVLLGIVNHFSREDFLSKLAELLKTILEWIMKSMVAVIVGLQVIQRMVTPMIDSLQRTVLGKTASAIPGIGNAIDSVTEMVLGCSLLIRNCLGAVALVVLLLLAAGPVLQLGITTLMYRALGAVSQPISDKRMVGCLSAMGDGCGLLLRVLITTEILFLVTIAIVASGGGT